MEARTCTDDLDTSFDLPFERRWWRIQRVIWGILVLVLLGGVTGVFGHGPLSKTIVQSPGSHLRVDYDWLARRETPALLRLHLDKAAVQSGQVRIWLNHALIDQVQLKQIVPEPIEAEPTTDGARFTFRIDPTADSATLIFTESPTSAGFVEAEIAVEGAEPVRFRQLVYP
jgi:hypothetical protein